MMSPITKQLAIPTNNAIQIGVGMGAGSTAISENVIANLDNPSLIDRQNFSDQLTQQVQAYQHRQRTLSSRQQAGDSILLAGHGLKGNQKGKPSVLGSLANRGGNENVEFKQRAAKTGQTAKNDFDIAKEDPMLGNTWMAERANKNSWNDKDRVDSSRYDPAVENQTAAQHLPTAARSTSTAANHHEATQEAEALDAAANDTLRNDLRAQLEDARQILARQLLPTAVINSSAQNTHLAFANVLNATMADMPISALGQGLATSVRGGLHGKAVAESFASGNASNLGSLYQAVGSDGWDSEMSHQIVMMVSNQKQEVALQLTPLHLGPMEIKLSMDQDQARLSFTVAHNLVRDAVQASLPRLSEMLAESGITLAQADVQSRGQQHQEPRKEASTQAGRAHLGKIGLADEGIGALVVPAASVVARPWRGGVSVFV